MGYKIRPQTGRASVWELARGQHGVVTRGQLLSLGYSSQGTKRRVANGRLHPVGSGVYAVGRPELTQKGRWMAAVLSCGAGAVLSHSSAAALWGIGIEWRRGIEVSVPRATHLKRAGLTVHRRKRLYAPDRATNDGIPVTSPAMTLVDLACRLGDCDLVRMINDADKRRVVRTPALRAFVAAHPRQDGVGRLKEILDRPTFRATDTKLEDWFLPLAEAAGLPVPLTQQEVNGFRVDFYWPNMGLVVETDGLTYHRTAAEQAVDRRRDQAHTAAGLTQLRFTHDQIRYEPRYVLGVLRAVAARLTGA